MKITKSFKEIEHLPAVHAARQKGVAIHKEIEDYMALTTSIENIKQPPFNTTTKETKLFVNWFVENSKQRGGILFPILSETMLFNRQFSIAGRLDFGWQESKSKVFVLGDIKTAKSVDLWATAWQLSLYRFMLAPAFPADKIFKLKVFSFDYNALEEKAELKVDDVSDYIPDGAIIKLLDCYHNGLPYEPSEVVLNKENRDVARRASELYEMIEMHQEQTAVLKAQLDLVKAKLYEAMLDNKVKSLRLKDDGTGKIITLSRIDKSIKRTLDTKRLREQHPAIYDEFAKEVEVSATVRIKTEEGAHEKIAPNALSSAFV
jgi:hypothetical protein